MYHFIRVLLLFGLTVLIGVSTRASISISETHVNVSCNGGNNGSINITPSGGIGSYTYLWSGSVTTEDRTSLPAGTYSVVVTDSVGTSASISVSITQPSAISTSKTITDIYCGGDSTGAVDFTVSGGVPGYTYVWNSGHVTQDIDSIPAATYYLTITDANGCNKIDSAAVIQPPGMVINESVTNSSCNGSNGAINLTIQYGVPGYTFVWNDSATTEDRAGVPDGNYSVTVTDASGCFRSENFIVGQTAGTIVINSTSTQPSCYGGSNGTITLLSVLGSTGPYTFTWSDGSATSQNRTGLAAGNYTVTATSSLGCSAEQTIAIGQPTAVNISYTMFPATCFGGNNGAITTTISGGTPSYTRSWSDGGSSANRFGLSSGTYTFIATDSRGCTDTQSIYVSQPIGLTVTTSTVPVSCAGGSTGAVLTSVSGGTASYSYLWNGAYTTPDRVNVPAGNYQVTVTDANSCSATSSATIPGYTPVTVSVTQITHNSCYSGNAGNIDITPGNGIPPYTYLWSNGDTNQDADSLALGAYVVTVTDNNSCTATATATISQPNPNITINSVVNDLTCFGYSDGSINLTAANGNPPYTYLWSNGATGANRTGLTAGTYPVTVTDNTLCTVSASLVVTEPTQLSVSLVPTDAACFGDSTGSIILNASGSFPPYNYSWNEGGNTQNRTDLPAGNYSVSVTDNNGCTSTATTTVSQPTEIIISGTKGDASCNGANDGFINVTGNGGQGPYTYTWDNGVTNPNNTGLGSGLHTVTVQDAAGCTKTYFDTIKEPLAISITSTATNASCNGGTNGTITLQVSGGNSPYSYYWTDADTSSAKTGLSSGSYSVTVTDNNSCTSAHATSVSESGTFAVSSVTTDVTCNGGSNGTITLTITGAVPPLSFNWGNSITQQNRTTLPQGTYTVTVSDNTGCAVVHSSTVNQPAPLVLTSGVTDASCNGGSDGAIYTSVVGGRTPYSFDWGGVTTQNRVGIPAGNYAVTVTDSSGCTRFASFVVNSQSTLVVSATVVQPTCNGSTDGSITLSVTGGDIPYRFVWNNGDSMQNRINLGAGAYQVTITDSIGCVQLSSFSFTQPPVLNVTATTTNVTCFGANDGSITVNSIGGIGPYSFIWNDSSSAPTKNSLSQGSYTVTVTDSRLCQRVISSVITEPDALSLNLAATNSSCFGQANGAINTTVMGGTGAYSYTWSDSITAANRTGLAAGNYTITVRDANSCSVIGTASVSQPAAVSTSITVKNVTCAGLSNGGVNLTITGGATPYTFIWNNDSITEDLNNVPAGNYSVTVTDAANCEYNQTATVSQPVPVTIDIQATDVSCFGASNGSINLTITGGTPPVSVAWNTNDSTMNISGLGAGNYSATLMDSNNCTVIVSTTIQEPSQIILSTTSVAEACLNSLDGAISLQVTGGTPPYVYTWDNGAVTQNLQGLAAGNYYVTVSDQNACIDSISETVIQISPIQVTSALQTTPCPDAERGTVDLTVSGGTPSYTFNWSNGLTTEDIIDLGQGTYRVTITDARGCTYQSDFDITADYILTIEASPSVTIEPGEMVQIAGETNTNFENSYSWETTGTVACATCAATTAAPVITTNYTINVSDTNGCHASDAFTIHVTSDNVLFLPNVFTPNQDGSNDVLELYGDLSQIVFLDFKVFNRWGEKVFESNDHHFAWDGTYKGEDASGGVYVYSMNIAFLNGESRSDSKGSVTLLR